MKTIVSILIPIALSVGGFFAIDSAKWIFFIILFLLGGCSFYGAKYINAPTSRKPEIIRKDYGQIGCGISFICFAVLSGVMIVTESLVFSLVMIAVSFSSGIITGPIAIFILFFLPMTLEKREL